PPHSAQYLQGRLSKPSAGPSPTEDFQRSLGSIGPATVAGFQKGDAVILISTEGTLSGEVTAITMVGGVEPMLTAPGGTKVITLSPWSIGMATVAGGKWVVAELPPSAEEGVALEGRAREGEASIEGRRGGVDQ